MKVAPRLLIAMLATLAMAGCRAAGTSSLAHQRPPEVKPQPTFDLDAFVADHNENAARIRSIEARPSIAVKISPPGEREQAGRVDGKLALERPRNFKLLLSHLRSDVADLGSNDERFWFWFSNKKDRSVYVCDYADLGSTSLAVTYQPDWIAEALGLREITPDEVAQVKVRPGPQPGTTVLAFPANRTGNQAASRLMIVSDRTRRIGEFRVFTPDGKEMLAQARIPGYHDYPLSSGDESGGDASAACYLPERIVLEWTRERISLDVALTGVKVNQFDPARRTALFVEPTPEGYARVNIAEVARQREPQAATTIRETMPAPEPRARSRRNPPLEIRGERAAATSPGPVPPRQPQREILLPVIEDVLAAPVPTAPRGSQTEGYSSLVTAPPSSLER